MIFKTVHSEQSKKGRADCFHFAPFLKGPPATFSQVGAVGVGEREAGPLKLFSEHPGSSCIRTISKGVDQWNKKTIFRMHYDIGSKILWRAPPKY